MVELVESVGLSECGKPNNSIVSYCAPNWETKVEAFIYSLSGVTLFRIGGKKQMNEQQEPSQYRAVCTAWFNKNIFNYLAWIELIYIINGVNRMNELTQKLGIFNLSHSLETTMMTGDYE